MSASAANAATPVDLKSAPVDADGRITLGDLFDGAGAASDTLVAATATPAVLDAGRVQSVARAAGLEWDNPTGLRRIAVRTGVVGGPVARSSAAAETLVYTRSIAAGEVVAAEDVAWAPVQAHQRPADAPGDVDTVIGKAARRPLRNGAAVAARDLSSPRVIARDDVVAVTFAVAGVRLTLQGKALAAAAIGEPVAVRNLTSNKVVQAVATGPGAAMVGPR